VQLIDAFSSLGSPIEFQTDTPSAFGLWNQTVEYGLYNQSMTEMEVWVSKEAGGSGTNYTYQDLKYWAYLFQQHFPGSAPTCSENSMLTFSAASHSQLWALSASNLLASLFTV